MIRVWYDPRIPLLKVRGHAGAGAKGADPVCAGVSALVQTLADDVKARGGRAELSPGGAVLWGNASCREGFAVIASGLRHMAAAYPRNLTFREGGIERTYRI